VREMSLVNLLMLYLCITESDEGAGRILYITDEAISRLLRSNSSWRIRLRVIYQRPVHQL